MIERHTIHISIWRTHSSFPFIKAKVGSSNGTYVGFSGQWIAAYPKNGLSLQGYPVDGAITCCESILPLIVPHLLHISKIWTDVTDLKATWRLSIIL